MGALKLSQTLLAIIAVSLPLVHCGKDVQTITVTSAKCNASSSFVYNITCFAKSYSRNHSTLNVIAIFKKAVTSVPVR